MHVSLRRRRSVVLAEVAAAGIHGALLLLLATRLTLLLAGRLLALARRWTRARDRRGWTTGGPGGSRARRGRAGGRRGCLGRWRLERALLKLVYLVRRVILIRVVLEQVQRFAAGRPTEVLRRMIPR